MRSSVKLISIAATRDIKNTFRIWRLNPWSTLAAYLALTIGIGGATTVFSALSSLLLSPLPIADSGRVLRITGVDKTGVATKLSMPDALDVKRRVQSASDFAFYRAGVGNVAQDSRPAMIRLLETDADMFKVLGVKPVRGRAFGRAANEPGHICEVVISWPFWQTQFGGRAVSGQTIRLNERPCIIDGVLPQQLDLPSAAELWSATPFDLNALANGRRIRSWYGLAHLKSNTGVAAFNAELGALSKALSREFPDEDTGLGMKATRLRDWLSEDAKTPLLILFVAVSFVLLMACANVANLLLARSSARLREISVRMAVGASRLMLFQQLLTESLILALASSLSGLLFTMAALHVLRDLPNLPIPRPESMVADWRVMLFAILMAAVTAILFGSLPAVRVSMTSLTGVLSQAGGRISETPRQQAIRKLLVGTETAIATVLLIASLLLLLSFNQVSKVHLGFQADHLLTAHVSLPSERYGKDTMDTVRFANRVIEGLTHVPGIEAASVVTSVPLLNNDSSSPVQIEGESLPRHESDSPFIINTGVSPAFRKTLRVPLLAGRDLQEEDNRDEGSAVMVNAEFARLFFPHGNAVGKRLRSNPIENPNARWLQIVGVIGDVRQFGLESEVVPELFFPLVLATNPFPAVIIRTSDSPASHVSDIKNAVREADPNVPVFLPRTMEQVEARRMGSRTFNTAMLSGFACVGLMLASGGIFAVIAYSVSQRTSEIGVRMACGASQSDITRMIVQQGLLPAFIGIGVGVLAALMVSRYMANLLFGVAATDLTAYAGTVLLLAAFCGAAALLPARQAARVEPWRALRHE